MSRWIKNLYISFVDSLKYKEDGFDLLVFFIILRTPFITQVCLCVNKLEFTLLCHLFSLVFELSIDPIATSHWTDKVAICFKRSVYIVKAFFWDVSFHEASTCSHKVKVVFEVCRPFIYSETKENALRSFISASLLQLPEQIIGSINTSNVCESFFLFQ